MELYLLSHQDLICCDSAIISGEVFSVSIAKNENISLYPKHTAGCLLLNNQILQEDHTHIISHKIDNDKILIEILPITNKSSRYEYKNHYVELAYEHDKVYVFFDGQYYGYMVSNGSPQFKVVQDKCATIVLDKNIIIFNEQLLYCGQYIDYEINKRWIQIYDHMPNIFNIGQLYKYEFSANQITVTNVKDCGEECIKKNSEFDLIYFIEAIKCKRYKYAQQLLTYELRANINIEVLGQYFGNFDKFMLIDECYITLKNNKVMGKYHFAVKNGLIDNIY